MRERVRMRLLGAAPLQLGVTLLVLVGGMVLAPGMADGQDGEACLDCALNENAGGRSLGPRADLTDGTEAPLFASHDSWTLRKRVDEVTVFFTATNGHRFVPGLTKENIRVTDDRKPVARISAFGHQRDLPLRLGLVVDTSGSVNPHFRLEQQLAIQFLRQMVRLGPDRAFVLGFANATHMTQDYSDDPEELAAGVMALRNGGDTALFDAIHSACDRLMAGEDSEPAARVLIVLSDGDDNSSKNTLLQTIDRAQRLDVTIYTVNTSNRIRVYDLPQPNEIALKRLAEGTGGRSFLEINKRELRKAFSTIEEEMRNRYALSYQPSDLKEDGRFRPIQIAAEKSGRRLRVHTRKGYYARLASSIE
jgi:Ca-activated chloride channel family protein